VRGQEKGTEGEEKKEVGYPGGDFILTSMWRLEFIILDFGFI